MAAPKRRLLAIVGKEEIIRVVDVAGEYDEMSELGLLRSDLSCTNAPSIRRTLTEQRCTFGNAVMAQTVALDIKHYMAVPRIEPKSCA